MSNKPTSHAYLFQRASGFYLMHLKDDADAIENARCNPGTLAVKDAESIQERIVWSTTPPAHEGSERPTPRTNKEIVCQEIHGYAEFDEGWFVEADFARQLERELTAAQRENQALREALEMVRDNIVTFESGAHPMALIAIEEIVQINKALNPT